MVPISNSGDFGWFLHAPPLNFLLVHLPTTLHAAYGGERRLAHTTAFLVPVPGFAPALLARLQLLGRRYDIYKHSKLYTNAYR